MRKILNLGILLVAALFIMTSTATLSANNTEVNLSQDETILQKADLPGCTVSLNSDVLLNADIKANNQVITEQLAFKKNVNDVAVLANNSIEVKKDATNQANENMQLSAENMVTPEVVAIGNELVSVENFVATLSEYTAVIGSSEVVDIGDTYSNVENNMLAILNDYNGNATSLFQQSQLTA